MPRSSTLPLGFIRPEIPTLVPEPPSGEGWIHEIRHDGYHALLASDKLAAMPSDS
jgi:bifunctional non-homologous end joining protein LigD